MSTLDDKGVFFTGSGGKQHFYKGKRLLGSSTKIDNLYILDGTTSIEPNAEIGLALTALIECSAAGKYTSIPKHETAMITAMTSPYKTEHEQTIDTKTFLHKNFQSYNYLI